MASGSTNDPGSWNRYAYSGGDPVNNSDPGGLESTSGSCDPAAAAFNQAFYDAACVPGGSLIAGNITSTMGAAMSGGIACPTCGGSVTVTDTAPSDGGGGGGFFSKIWNGIKSIGSSIVNNILNPGPPANCVCGSIMSTGNLSFGQGVGVGIGATIAAAVLAPEVVGAEVVGEVTGASADVTFTHFTNAEGVEGITGVNVTGMTNGQTLTVPQLNFGMGSNGYLANAPGDIFLTNLPPTTPIGQLMQIGVFGDKQSFAITGISGVGSAGQGVLVQGAGGSIYNIPGGSTLTGCFTIVCR